jgi:phosphoribosylglycinamide formyltransferase 1
MSAVDQPIVILISGNGSNMAALVEASKQRCWAQRWGGRVVAVISNRPDAPGLTWAREQGLATAVVDHRPRAGRPSMPR